MNKVDILDIIIPVIGILVIIMIFGLIVIGVKQDIDYGIKEGQVIDKSYQSAYTTMSTSGNVTIPQYHPERYSIKIQKNIEGKIKSIWISVDRDTYHSISIGDYYGKEERTNENT